MTLFAEIGWRRLLFIAMVVAMSAPVALGQASTSRPAGPSGDDVPPAITVERRGAAEGQAMIFLPALGFPGSCWSRVAAQFEKDHPIYLITYAGTDGAPPTKPPYLGRIIRDIRVLIDREKLKAPLLVGHLLGAHVALSVAGEYPDAVGGVFAMPLVAPRPPQAERRQAAMRAASYYGRGADEIWEANLSMEAQRAVENPATAEEILRLLRRADRGMYAGLAADIIADAIEARLPRVTCPVCLVALVGLPRESSDPDARQMKPSELARTTVDRMKGLYPGLARCDQMSLRGTRLVPLYDHADRVAMQLERFVGKVSNPNAHWGTTRMDAKSPPRRNIGSP